MFKTKICGITSVTDCQTCIDAGADAIGLNFVESSKRFVDLATASQIAGQAAGCVAKLGVFANHPSERVARAFNELELDYVQLHGSESARDLKPLAGIPIVKSIHCSTENLAQVRREVDEILSSDLTVAAILVDAVVPGEIGGTGQVADWDAASRLRETIAPTPLILAGGLTEENVGKAIEVVAPHAVDTASGVEMEPRRKDADKVRAFVQAAKSAFAKIAPS